MWIFTSGETNNGRQEIRAAGLQSVFTVSLSRVKYFTMSMNPSRNKGFFLFLKPYTFTNFVLHNTPNIVISLKSDFLKNQETSKKINIRRRDRRWDRSLVLTYVVLNQP